MVFVSQHKTVSQQVELLRIHRRELSPSTLGKYLGEGGNDRAETEYWNLIRFNFIRAISFIGMSVEEG